MHSNNRSGKSYLKMTGILLLAAGSAFASGSGGSGGGGTTSACTWLQSVTVKAGYPSNGLSAYYAAIWTTINAQECTPVVGAVITVTVTNLDVPDSIPVSWGYYLTPKFAFTADDDAVAFSTHYRVDVVITDPSGAVLDSKSFLTLTPAPKVATTP